MMAEFNYIMSLLASDLPKVSICFITVNLLTFALFGIDKYKAIHQKWRISEFTLLMLSFFGGALGAGAGMILFRHKIRKPVFYILVPLFAVLYIAAMIYLIVLYFFL